MAFLRFMWARQRWFVCWVIGWLPFSFLVLPRLPPVVGFLAHISAVAWAFYMIGVMRERKHRTADAQQYGQTLAAIKGFLDEGVKKMETVQWFGPKPFAAVCADDNRRDTPTGAECFYCEEPILAGESGMLALHSDSGGDARKPWHRECFLRSLSGSVAHLRKRCPCYGGSDPEEPAGMTRRQEAALAAKLWSGEN